MRIAFAHTRAKTKSGDRFEEVSGQDPMQPKGFLHVLRNCRWDLDPPLHAGDQGTIEVVDFSGRIGSEESKGRTIGSKGYGDHFLGFPRCDPHRLSAEVLKEKGPRLCFSTTTTHRLIHPASSCQN